MELVHRCQPLGDRPEPFDFETVLTHELGHALGLGHSPDTSSTLYATLAPGTARRMLTTADLNLPDDGAGPDALHAAPSTSRSLSSPRASRTRPPRCSRPRRSRRVAAAPVGCVHAPAQVADGPGRRVDRGGRRPPAPTERHDLLDPVDSLRRRRRVEPERRAALDRRHLPAGSPPAGQRHPPARLGRPGRGYVLGDGPVGPAGSSVPVPHCHRHRPGRASALVHRRVREAGGPAHPGHRAVRASGPEIPASEEQGDPLSGPAEPAEAALAAVAALLLADRALIAIAPGPIGSNFDGSHRLSIRMRTDPHWGGPPSAARQTSPKPPARVPSRHPRPGPLPSLARRAGI